MSTRICTHLWVISINDIQPHLIRITNVKQLKQHVKQSSLMHHLLEKIEINTSITMHSFIPPSLQLANVHEYPTLKLKNFFLHHCLSECIILTQFPPKIMLFIPCLLVYTRCSNACQSCD